jgi:CheY-like chemotaxis protein
MTFNALIIDNDTSNINALTALIRREGGTCFSVRSPADVVESLDQIEPVDIVFLDFEFPNHNGLEWITILKNDERLASCPFVAYTVHTSEQTAAWAAGFHSFLGKPLNVEKFPDYLSQILKGIPVWEAE